MNAVPAFFASALTLTSLALAQTPARVVEFNLTQALAKSEAAGRAEILVPEPQTVAAGDLLQQDLTVINVSGQDLNHVLVTVPITGGTQLTARPTSSRQWTVQYFVDGGHTYTAPPLPTMTAQGNSGKTKRPGAHLAPTHVRWVGGHLSPDESLKLSFRGKVN